MTKKSTRVIIVTGTPGTGKTTLAKKLAKAIGAHYVNVTKFVTRHKLDAGIDRKRRTRIIDMPKTRKALGRELKVTGGLVVVDTHIPDGIVPEKSVKLVYVLRCHPRILERRLRAKKWRKSKIRENVLAEIIDSCLISSVKQYGWSRVLQLDTSHAGLARSVYLARRRLRGRPVRQLKIDWLAQLEKNDLLDYYLEQ